MAKVQQLRLLKL